MYFAEPSASMNGRRIECARGKVVGGSSAINAMAYYHGHRSDYDRWAANRLPQWSYAHVLPYFRRQETWEGGADTYRGGDGPLTTQYSRFEDPLCQAFMEAGRAAGHPVTDDYNGAQQEGFAPIQMTLRNGRRCSAATAYLRPAMARPNLTVEVNALATRIVMEGRARDGIEYVQGGAAHTAHAEREVILAGGSINSPQLLMLSGIGAPDALKPHGIAPRIPLKGVGKGLLDHTSAAMTFRRKQPGPFQRNMRLDRVALALAQAHLLGRGFASDLPFGITAFLKTPAGGDGPRHSDAVLDGRHHHCRALSAAVQEAVRRQLLMPRDADAPGQPRPRRLASADPATPVRIHQNFLGTDDEWRVMRAGLRMIRDIVSRPQLAALSTARSSPGPGLRLGRRPRCACPRHHGDRAPSGGNMHDGAGV